MALTHDVAAIDRCSRGTDGQGSETGGASLQLSIEAGKVTES